MILKQKAFEKLIHIMKLKENQEKSHIAVSNPHNNKPSMYGVEQSDAEPTRPQNHRYPWVYNLYSTSEPDTLVASKQQRDIL